VTPALQSISPDAHLVQLWLYGRSGHTIRAYKADIERFLARAGKPIAQVTLGDLQHYAESLKSHSPATVHRSLSAIKSLLAFGHRLGFLPVDVGAALRLPNVRNHLSERILPEDDVRSILRLETNPRNQTILAVLYWAGIRVSELCALRWRDVQPGQITVLGKGGKTRSIQIPAELHSQIAQLRGSASGNDPVFISRKKAGSLQPSTVLRIVKAAAQRAGIEAGVSPHWLRHAHASHALDHGAPIHLVQATLGHASIATTGRYLHARPKESSSRFLSW